MDHPNLADPNFEPSDAQIEELMQRAFAGVTEAHRRALRELHERIAREAAENLRQWEARRPCNPS
jgi:hypothetical protein